MKIITISPNNHPIIKALKASDIEDKFRVVLIKCYTDMILYPENYVHSLEYEYNNPNDSILGIKNLLKHKSLENIIEIFNNLKNKSI